MGTTPNYSIPYAELANAPDGPQQQQDLATAVDTALVGLASDIADGARFGNATQEGYRIASGKWGVSVTNEPNVSGTLSFGVTFSAPPVVVVTLVNAGTGIESRWNARLRTVSSTDATYVLNHNEQSSQSMTGFLHFIAIGPV